MYRGRVLFALVVVTAALASIPSSHAQTGSPDVAVVDVGWDQLEPNQETTFTATLENQGDANRTDSFDVHVHLEDAGFSDNVTVERLNESETITIEASTPWDAQAGNYTLNATAKVDEGLPGIEDEPDENNAYNRSFKLGPDLVLEKVRVQPGSPVQGEQVRFAATVTNVETGADVEQGIDIEFTIRDEEGDTETRTASLDGLRSLETKRRLSSSWLASDPGSYTVTAHVDPGDQIEEVDPGNNTASRDFDVTPAQPDLVLTSVAPNRSAPQAGENVSIRAVVENQGNANVTSDFPVRFRVNGSTFGPDVHVQVDDPLQPGQQATVYSQNWTTQRGHHTLTAIADPGNQNVTDEASEENNERTTSLHVGPDLVVADVLWTPTPPAADNPVDLQPRILNQGTADVLQETTVEVRIPDQDLQWTAEIGPLGAGNSTQLTVGTWEDPDEGSYDVEAEADVDDEAEEIDDANNERTETMTVTQALPDIVATNVQSTPTQPQPGDDTTFEVTIENRGSAATSGFEVQFLVDGDQVGENKTVAGGQFEELGAGESTTVTSDAWTARRGNNTLLVAPDPNNNVTEIVEDNNNLSQPVIVGPDATVEDIRWIPPDPGVGDEVTFEAVVANVGTEPIASLPVLLSLDSTPLDNATVTGLDPKENATVSTIWEATQGNHTVQATVDPNDTLEEAREGNNDRVESFSAPASADLEITSLRWSEDPRAGDTLVFTAQVANTGPADVEGSFAARFTIGDEPLGRVTIDGGLESGQSTSVSSDDWTATAGTHAIRAAVDPADVVTEESEDNNARVETVTVGSPRQEADEGPGGPSQGPPNLVVAGISLPEDPGPGDEVTFLATIENEGGGLADASAVRFLIDDDPLGQRSIGALEGGQSSSVTSRPWNVTAGEHTVTVLADAGDEVDEANEDDNERLATFTVQPDDDETDRPPLELSASYPGNIQAGDSVRLSAAVSNDGSTPVTDLVVTFSVDGQQLGQARIDRLVPGANATARGPLWNATAGEHTIQAEARGVQVTNTVNVGGEDGAESIPAPGAMALGAALVVGALARNGRRRER